MTKTERLPVGTAIRDTGVIAIVRAPTPAYLRPVCDTLLDAGVRGLEITTNTPGWATELRRLRAAHGDRIELGVGTVREPGQADAAADAGAGFVVAPDLNPEVGRRAAELGLGWYPGALTPTEIAAAWRAGATAVKVFPAATFGPDYLRHLRAPLDDVALIPTGGVTSTTVPDYFAAGAAAVGMAGPLLGDALRTGDITALPTRVRTVLTAVRDAR